jgi:TonB family protein
MSVRALRFDDMRLEWDEVRNNTRWTMTVSVGLHVILLLLLALVRPTHHETPTLTEITMIDPADLEPASAAAAASAASAPITATPVSGIRYNSDRDIHFKRDAVADVAPDPQSDRTATDRMNARLAAMQQTAVTPISSGGTNPSPSALWATPAGAPTGLGTSGQSVSLQRGGAGSGPPIALGRGGGTSSASALANVATPAASGQAEAPARAGDSGAHRALAGASLAGPIADRAILRSTTPVYPDWAKKDGVEGSVSIYFVVRADGSVKENVMVQKTAGFSDFDDNARTAILAWRFEPLHGGRTGEQWGTITFDYRLRNVQ